MRGAWKLMGVAIGLLLQTACLEHFAGLETTVRYDAFTQQFEVQRVLRNVSPAFFGCVALDDCTEAIGRAVQLQPAPFPTALSDRLVQRLVESGAEGIRVQLVPRGDTLDAHIAYRAAVGSAAAEDTMVHAEWDGKQGYYLVVDADASLQPLDVKARVRKTAVSGPEGIDWREAWVLKPKQTDVTTRMNVDDSVRAMFATIPGLGDALASRGWLDGDAPPTRVDASPPAVAVASAPQPDPVPVPAAVDGASTPVSPAPASPAPVSPAPVSPAPVSPAPVPVPTVVQPTPTPTSTPEPVAVAAPVPAVSPSPSPSPAAPAARSWPAPNPDSPARTYVYDARVSGGGISAAAATVSAEPLLPRVKVCYQEAVARDPAVGGSAFLSALVAGDGALVSTSVYGSVNDPPLMRCLEQAIEGWRFAPWGGEGVSDVAIPLVFRVEAVPDSKRGKRGKR